MATIGEQLKTIRDNRSLTIQELTKQCGVSEKALLELESDSVEVSISVLLKISRELNVTFYIGETEI